MEERRVQVLDLGTVEYARAVEIQQAIVARRLAGEAPDTLLLLEHPPTITLGRRGSLADVYLTESALARQGVALARTTRGGLVTYHGPGQVVGYPILKLHAVGLTVPRYVHTLEDVIVDALAGVGVTAWTDPAHVGVWTARGKIAAIGVAQQRGVTLHGFAVNLQPNLAHFRLINPCGIGDLGVTSAADLLGQPIDRATFQTRLCAAFAARFDVELADADPAGAGYSILSTLPSDPR